MGPPIQRVLLASLLVSAAGYALAAEIELIPIARRDGAVTVIVSTNSPLIAKTGEWCRQFLVRRGFQAGIVSSGPGAGTSSALWVLETESHCPMARALGAQMAGLATARVDGYCLGVSETNSQAVVLIIGKDAVGVRSGVARLIAESVEEDAQLLAPRGTAIHSPFFPIRELVVANRGVVLDGTPYADTLWRRWSDERIRTYAEQLWLLGFNSIQLCEGRSFQISAESEPRAVEVARKLEVLSRAAHDNGLGVSQLVWGQAPFNRKMCWNNAASRAVMEQEFRWMARTYAVEVDHVVLHMRDPGGCDCGTCDDYKTPQQIAAFVLKEYQKVNPGVTLTLSALGHKFGDVF